MKLSASSQQMRLPSAMLLLAIAGLAGCAQPYQVTGAFAEGATRAQTFKNLLIVGVSPDYRPRCNFEWELVKLLRSNSVKAIASCSVMTAEEHLSRESIERVVAEQGSDGVLASFLVTSNTAVREGGSRETRGYGQYKVADVGYGGAYGMPMIYVDFQVSQSIFTQERDIVLTSQLYETRGASPVYKIESKVKTDESSGAIIAVVTQEIADRLHESGLIL